MNAADPLLPVANLFLGQTYKLPVLRMNGLTQGAYYGDDSRRTRTSRSCA